MADPLRSLGLSPPADDYGRPEDQRWTQPLSARAVTALTALGAVAVGFLLTAGVAAGRTEADAQDAREEQLITVIQDRQQHVDSLERELEQLRGRVADVEAGSGPAGALQRTVADTEVAAGLRGVRGPGVRVMLDDARSSCRGAQPQDCRIQDADLQLAVNALFSAGAEAVAIGGERVIGTTAIRGAGGSILVNYRVLAAPYVVDAIGDPQGLLERFSASELARDFAAWTEVFGLGFAVEEVSELVLPAYGGGLRLEHAVLAEAVEGTGGREEAP